ARRALARDEPPAAEQRAREVPLELQALLTVEEHELQGGGRPRAGREGLRQGEQEPHAAAAVVGADEREVVLLPGMPGAHLGVVMAAEHDALAALAGKGAD